MPGGGAVGAVSRGASAAARKEAARAAAAVKKAEEAAAAAAKKTRTANIVAGAAVGAGAAYVAVDTLSDSGNNEDGKGDGGILGNLFGGDLGNVFTSQNISLSGSSSLSCMLFAGAVFYVVTSKKKPA